MWNYETYNSDCQLLTSRDPSLDYMVIKQRMVDMLKDKTNLEIEKIEAILVNKDLRAVQEMKTLVDPIFDSAMGNIHDENHIGFINILLTQCTILFTIRYVEPYSDKEPSMEMYDALKIDWWDYTALKRDILTKKGEVFYDYENLRCLLGYEKGEFFEYTLENISDPTVVIFLVKWMNRFSSDEEIRSFFQNIHHCEIITTSRFADAVKMTPYEFLEHDIQHVSSNNCWRQGYDLNKFYRFYNYCSENLEKDKFRKIRVFMFFEIHESQCHLNVDELVTVTREKSKIPYFKYFKNEVTSRGDIYYRRFRDKRDLIEMIPPSKRTDEGTIEYLIECIDLYKLEYDKWKSVNGLGKRVKKTRKDKQTVKRKTRQTFKKNLR